MHQNQTKIIIRDLKIDALIGIFPKEIGQKQAIIVNVEGILDDYRVGEDKITSTVSYAPIIEEIHRAANRQFSLAEKLAEHIADFCLAYPKIQSVKVRVEKPDIFPEAIVGAEIIRTKP